MPEAINPASKPGLNSWKDVVLFVCIAAVSSSLTSAWLVLDGLTSALPSASFGNSAAGVLLATVHWGVAGALGFAPLLVCGFGRWLRVCCFGLLAGGAILSVVLGGDAVRLLGIGFLTPVALVLWCRALHGVRSSLGERVGYVLVWLVSALAAFPFLRLAFFDSISTAGDWPAGCAGILIFWAGPLYLEGRDFEQVARTLRIAPVRNARDDRLNGYRTFEFSLIGVIAGLLSQFVERASGDLEAVLIMTALLLPLVIRKPRLHGLLAVWLLPSCLWGVIAFSEWLPYNQRDWVLVPWFIVLGLAGLGLVAGRVEWRQRVVRIVVFLLAVVGAFALLAASSARTVAVVALGPILIWVPVFLADHWQLPSRDEDEQAAARLASAWKPALGRLIQRVHVETAAVVLFALGVVLPFMCVATAWGSHRSKQRCPGACKALPELEVQAFGEKHVAASATIDWTGLPALVDASAPKSLPDVRKYMNELSVLEGLLPCYEADTLGIGPGDCSGYLVIEDAHFVEALRTAEFPLEKLRATPWDPNEALDERKFRVIRELTYAESVALRFAQASWQKTGSN
jgi:hypothetical protein